MIEPLALAGVNRSYWAVASTAAELVRTFHGEGESAASTGVLFLPPLDDLLWQREWLAAGRLSGDGRDLTKTGLLALQTSLDEFEQKIQMARWYHNGTARCRRTIDTGIATERK